MKATENSEIQWILNRQGPNSERCFLLVWLGRERMKKALHALSASGWIGTVMRQYWANSMNIVQFISACPNAPQIAPLMGQSSRTHWISITRWCLLFLIYLRLNGSIVRRVDWLERFKVHQMPFNSSINFIIIRYSTSVFRWKFQSILIESPPNHQQNRRFYLFFAFRLHEIVIMVVWSKDCRH